MQQASCRDGRKRLESGFPCTITLRNLCGKAGIKVPPHLPCGSSDSDGLGPETDALSAIGNEVAWIRISLRSSATFRGAARGRPLTSGVRGRRDQVRRGICAPGGPPSVHRLNSAAYLRSHRSCGTSDSRASGQCYPRSHTVLATVAVATRERGELFLNGGFRAWRCGASERSSSVRVPPVPA